MGSPSLTTGDQAPCDSVFVYSPVFAAIILHPPIAAVMFPAAPVNARHLDTEGKGHVA